MLFFFFCLFVATWASVPTSTASTQSLSSTSINSDRQDYVTSIRDEMARGLAPKLAAIQDPAEIMALAQVDGVDLVYLDWTLLFPDLMEDSHRLIKLAMHLADKSQEPLVLLTVLLQVEWRMFLLGTMRVRGDDGVTEFVRLLQAYVRIRTVPGMEEALPLGLYPSNPPEVFLPLYIWSINPAIVEKWRHTKSIPLPTLLAHVDSMTVSSSSSSSASADSSANFAKSLAALVYAAGDMMLREHTDPSPMVPFLKATQAVEPLPHAVASLFMALAQYSCDGEGYYVNQAFVVAFDTPALYGPFVARVLKAYNGELMVDFWYVALYFPTLQSKLNLLRAVHTHVPASKTYDEHGLFVHDHLMHTESIEDSMQDGDFVQALIAGTTYNWSKNARSLKKPRGSNVLGDIVAGIVSPFSHRFVAINMTPTEAIAVPFREPFHSYKGTFDLHYVMHLSNPNVKTYPHRSESDVASGVSALDFLRSYVVPVDAQYGGGLAELRDDVQKARWVALDFEFTGVTVRKYIADSGERAYESAMEHAVFETGFFLDNSSTGDLVAASYTMTTSPIDKGGKMHFHSLPFIKANRPGFSILDYNRKAISEQQYLKPMLQAISDKKSTVVVVHNGFTDLLHACKVVLGKEEMQQRRATGQTPLQIVQSMFAFVDTKHIFASDPQHWIDCYNATAPFDKQLTLDDFRDGTRSDTSLSTLVQLLLDVDTTQVATHDAGVDAAMTGMLFRWFLEQDDPRVRSLRNQLSSQ